MFPFTPQHMVVWSQGAQRMRRKQRIGQAGLRFDKLKATILCITFEHVNQVTCSGGIGRLEEAHHPLGVKPRRAQQDGLGP